MSAITALTAQNTCGVQAVMEASPGFLCQQLDAVFTDIRPDAVKVGMMSSSVLVEVAAGRLACYGAENVVVDPVMVATSGSRLACDEAVEALKRFLFPLACLITPNIPEAEVLAGMAIRTPRDMQEAARLLHERYGCAVLCKGGHALNDANDFLQTVEGGTWLCGERIENPNTHGTGCTLSSAVATYLAQDVPLLQAVKQAKAYVAGALAAQLNLGQGSGPLDHAYGVRRNS